MAQLAARQHGNVTRAQLLGAGLTNSGIRTRVGSGRLFRVHQRVYAVGRPAVSPLERAAAAVLACGQAALLSHQAALALWELAPWPAQMHVTAPNERRPEGVKVHRCRTLTRRDARRRHGIPVTSPARTLLDCAPQLAPRDLRRGVNQALRDGVLRRSQLRELLSRSRTHPGGTALRRLAEEPGAPTRSVLEDDFLAFCRRHRLPHPRVNVIVCGYEVDAYFPAERVIVELDGWEYHRDRSAFESDRRRDADTLAQGIVTVRITWDRLHRNAAEEARRLHGILSARRDQTT